MIVIREERPEDGAAIHALVQAAFGQPLEADLVDRLREDGDSVISLVADDGEIVGHIMFSRMQAPFRTLGLAPVSVAPHRQRSGIGGRLIREGLDRARRAGWQVVIVLGDPDYYRRFGFDPALAQGFESPYAGPYLMALPLGDAMPASSGRLEYAPAFSGLE